MTLGEYADADAGGIGLARPVLLVRDRVGWHTTDQLSRSERVYLELLLSYSSCSPPSDCGLFFARPSPIDPDAIAALTADSWWKTAVRPVV